MLTVGDRPRQLKWYHAGPMLYGDWGTSRLYVLGLAMFYTQFASFNYLVPVCVMLLAVGWAYEVVCRLYPEGGGVYTAARQRAPLLGMIGALLLCADYVVTAAISAVEAIHYAGLLPHSMEWAVGPLAAILIALIGVVNYYGPTKAGAFAAVIAVATIIFSVIVAAFALPTVLEGKAHLEPIRATTIGAWAQFTKLILAISGVEAIANMTGIMVKPVVKTARWSIYPVLAEIVILNIILGLAMQALPKERIYTAEALPAINAGQVIETVGEDSPVSTEAKNTMMKILADHYVSKNFSRVAAIVFALLLLSAVNTAVSSLVSIQYMMAADGELPSQLRRLNMWGMPVIPLIIGVIVPAITVILVPQVEKLADLYAIGVVGAVAINLAACSTNFSLDMKSWERWPIFALAVLMALIWITIAVEKPMALLFASSIVALGLGGQWTARNARKLSKAMVEPVLEMVEKGAAAAHDMVSGEVAQKKRLLVSTYGNMKLLKHAIEQAKLQEAELFVLFVRYVAIIPMGDVKAEDWHDDPGAAKMFGDVEKMAKEEGIKVHFLYAQTHDIAGMILDMAATYGVTELFLGTTQRGSLWRTMKGDVIQQVAQFLPEPIKLIIHA